jgi:hypothetical protein
MAVKNMPKVSHPAFSPQKLVQYSESLFLGPKEWAAKNDKRGL